MSPENHILRDLAAGRSTAAAIADRLGMEKDEVRAHLSRLINEGKVTISVHLAGTIPIYELAKL
ncbi:winged helix-turn-helix transcriptional regulator [Luteolibacter sp. SL250]|uniref:winged helix-turn-helix transcriptional regulator n=1 Tax=Luteolibacter sp. SL250 TaxID=2995170 RepID=UPI002271F680|nr:winged helix-turn-helix transcriptional regulator [Luteolibacter sp. SL250]WAC21012.1 winged helix-turn-helix transcriptional regulator [Luteolibacter sp. SL250]